MKIIHKIKNKLIKLRIELKKETDIEKNNRTELLNSVINLNNKEILGCSAWDRYRRKLRLYILKNDPRNFLRWEPIMGSMFHEADKLEFDHLADSNKDSWMRALEETWVGNPPYYPHYKKSSGNMIHIAYNLSQIFDRYKIDLKKINTITEFGAGYGCAARLIHNLGFKGTYEIFDVPEFLALQKYYLKTTNTNGRFIFVDKAVKLKNTDTDMLIATWSLSESPIEIRNEFLKRIGKPQYILIAYQANFELIDNIKYFDEYQKNNSNYNWITHEIKHLPNNYYLIGSKK